MLAIRLFALKICPATALPGQTQNISQLICLSTRVGYHTCPFVVHIMESEDAEFQLHILTEVEIL